MPARDRYHFACREALEKDGWVITNDPFFLRLGKTKYPIDLAAEKMLAAEKEGQRIAVEIKSFLGDSLPHEFHEALGQYLEYRLGLELVEPERVIFLALPVKRWEKLTELSLPTLAIAAYKIQLLIFDPIEKCIIEWKKA